MPHRASTGQLLYEFVLSSKSSLRITTELAAIAISTRQCICCEISTCFFVSQGRAGCGFKPQLSPEWPLRWHELDRHPLNEGLHPLGQILYAGLLRNHVPQHDQSFPHAERCCVRHV